MKQAFFEYIGNKNSLIGYQRSNRLVFLKSFFTLFDKTGKALVCDVVSGYKDFYKNRKEKGLITDVGADVVIENIENSIHSEVLSVIKRHPYRVLNEKGYLTISMINKQDYFVLNELLNSSLSEKDISEIKLLLEQKIDFYYSKIDEVKKDVEIIQLKQHISEQKIDDVFNENYYSEFRDYCKQSNIVLIAEIEPVDFVAFRSTTSSTPVFIKEIKDRIMQIYKDKYKSGVLNKESTNGKVTSERIDALLTKKFFIDTIEICKNDDAELEDKGNYCDDGLLIINVFYEGIFNNFKQFCTKNKIIHIKDLDGFDFYKLLEIKGFRVTGIEQIMERYNAIIGIDTKGDKIENHFHNFLIFDQMKIRIRQLIGLNDQFTEEELIILDKISCVVNELGVDICQMAYLHPLNVGLIANALETFACDIKGDKIENQVQKFFISEQMKIRIKQLIELNNQFSKVELIKLKKISYAVNEIGVDICQMAYLHPLNVGLIANALETFAGDIIAKGEQVKKLYSVFNNINKSNKDIKVYSLVIAYTADVIKRKILINAFVNCSTVVEITRELINISKDYLIHVEVIKFMEWLQIDLKESLINSYVELFKKDSYREIINCRANGATLEAAGKVIGVTRERVRQIEKKVQLRFDYQNIRKRFMWIIYAFCGKNTIIYKQELIDYLGGNAIEFVYLLKNSNSKCYCYSEKLDAFIIDIQIDFDKLKEFIDTFPDIIFSTDMDLFTKKIVDEYKGPIEFAQKMVLGEYKLSGQVYHKKRISLTEMYGMVLKKYYPAGAKLFDETEQERFRRYIVEMFGNVRLPPNNRALDVRVADIGVLCDRGTYIHQDYIKTNIALIEEIKEYIKNGKKISYAFLELFEYFKEKLLLNTNINNRYFLQGVLKHYYKTEFYFTKDMISKSLEIGRIDDQIEKFVGRYDLVTKDQLRKEFTGITEAMLFFAVSRCKEVIVIENGVYMHTKHLNIIKSDYEISKIIDDLITEMPVSCRKLLEVMYSTHTDFLNRNLVFSYTKLFSILQYMLRDKYKFSRPFIAKQDTKNITNMVVVKNYLNGRDSYEISELTDFCEEHHLRFLSLATLIDDLSDKFIRVDSYMYMNIEQIDIDEDKIETIINILKDTIFLKGYISARKINDFMFFPDIGIEWNGYLLKSIVDKYVAEIAVLQIPTSDTFLLSAVFLNNDCNFDSYEEFLRSVVKCEHDSAQFKNINEMKQWLQEEELINQNIPNFMFEKNYLYVDEFGKIIVE